MFSVHYRNLLICLPLSTILPNKFFPLRKFLVEQFHLLCLNWCWHSATAMLAPLATADRTPGFSLASLRCFRLNVAWTAGSMYKTPGDKGAKLFGSPAFAMPLSKQKKVKVVTQKTSVYTCRDNVKKSKYAERHLKSSTRNAHLW